MVVGEFSLLEPWQSRQVGQAGVQCWESLLNGTLPKYSSVIHGLITFSICPFQQWVLREEAVILDMKLKLNLILKKKNPGELNE